MTTEEIIQKAAEDIAALDGPPADMGPPQASPYVVKILKGLISPAVEACRAALEGSSDGDPLTIKTLEMLDAVVSGTLPKVTP